MPRKKKPEVINGIGSDPENKLVVQKSRPLFALWASDLTLAEFKLLDMYLARINTRDPDHRTVQLTKGELETALGVTRINQPDLAARLKHLYQPINLAKGEKRRLHLVGLFEEAEAEQDKDGQWRVTLACTTAAMRYIFKAEELGYLRYKLRSITGLTSRYSYVLFCYLEDNRFRKTWTVDIDELKAILACNDDDLYREYKRFNERILKRCHAELTAKTECRFTYQPVKAGKRVTAIRFELETISEVLPEIDPDQMSLFAANGSDVPGGDIELWCDALPGFTIDEVEEIAGVLRTVPKSKLPMPEAALSLRRYHYLLQVCAKMQRYDAKKPIKHKLAYLLKTIGQDALEGGDSNA